MPAVWRAVLLDLREQRAAVVELSGRRAAAARARRRRAAAARRRGATAPRPGARGAAHRPRADHPPVRQPIGIRAPARRRGCGGPAARAPPRPRPARRPARTPLDSEGRDGGAAGGAAGRRVSGRARGQAGRSIQRGRASPGFDIRSLSHTPSTQHPHIRPRGAGSLAPRPAAQRAAPAARRAAGTPPAPRAPHWPHHRSARRARARARVCVRARALHRRSPSSLSLSLSLSCSMPSRSLTGHSQAPPSPRRLSPLPPSVDPSPARPPAAGVRRGARLIDAPGPTPQSSVYPVA
jgi:hypothetical protein